MTTVISVSGFLSRDPETRVTPNGAKVTSLSIPVTIGGQNKSTVWWRASFWGDKFEKMMPYLKKGSCLIVTGTMTRAPTTYVKEGKTMINSLEISADMIQFAPGKKQEETVQTQVTPHVYKTSSQPNYEPESDLPF